MLISNQEEHVRFKHRSNPVFAMSFHLLTQYGGKAIIPIEIVRKDYFPHLATEVLARKISCGEISLLLSELKTAKKPQGASTSATWRSASMPALRRPGRNVRS